jgi:hypothetical protein
VLIHRNYRGDVDPQAIDCFLPCMTEREEEGNTAPIVQYGEMDLHFVYVKVNGLFCKKHVTLICVPTRG